MIVLFFVFKWNVRVMLLQLMLLNLNVRVQFCFEVFIRGKGLFEVWQQFYIQVILVRSWKDIKKVFLNCY